MIIHGAKIFKAGQITKDGFEIPESEAFTQDVNLNGRLAESGRKSSKL
jgi:hypothetical protein